MTEFSKTLLVFFKWPDLTDVQDQGISCTTGVAYLLGRVPGSNPSVWLSRYTIPVLEYQHPGETLASIRGTRVQNLDRYLSTVPMTGADGFTFSLY